MTTCRSGRCEPTVERPSRRCNYHAALAAKATMEKQGWVCITVYYKGQLWIVAHNEFGHDAAKAVSERFMESVHAVQLAGVELQQWMAGWDDQKDSPVLGIWAPKPVAVILGVCEGKLDRHELAAALRQIKINKDFVVALDVAWRLGGNEAAIAIIRDELPHLAMQLGKHIKQA